jgi:hypothetical protein
MVGKQRAQVRECGEDREKRVPASRWRPGLGKGDASSWKDQPTCSLNRQPCGGQKNQKKREVFLLNFWTGLLFRDSTLTLRIRSRIVGGRCGSCRLAPNVTQTRKGFWGCEVVAEGFCKQPRKEVYPGI